MKSASIAMLLTACAVLLVSPSADAQEAWLYKLQGNFVDNEIVRINLRTRDTETLPWKVEDFNDIQDAVIDTRNDLLCVRLSTNYNLPCTFRAYDLHTGEMRTEVDKLSSTTMGLEYNPVDGKIYLYELHDKFDQIYSWCLSSIDPLTGELQRFEPFSGNPATWSGFIRLDYMRGLLWNFGNWTAADIRTGHIVRDIQGVKPQAIAFNYATGTFFGFERSKFRRDTLFRYFEFDPGSNTIDFIYNFRELEYHPAISGTTLDPVHGHFYTSNSRGTIGVYSKDGDFLDQYLIPGVTTRNFWLLYRSHLSGGALSRVTGKVLTDHLNTCKTSDATPLAAGVKINFTPGDYRTWVKDDGEFVVRLPAGKYYTANLDSNEFRQDNCPENPLQFAVAEDGSYNLELDYLLQVKRPAAQPDVSLAAAPISPGREFKYTLRLANNGTLPVDGTLVFTYDPRLTYTGADLAPDAISAGRTEWKINALAGGAVRKITISCLTSADESIIGEDLCAEAFLLDEDGIEWPGKRSSDEFCGIVGSTQPSNRIDATPRGYGDKFMLPLDQETMAYTIRFQNSGNTQVNSITITDTLVSKLPGYTLRPGAASHDYSISLINGNIVTIHFDNINLPPAAQNETESCGYVKFSLDLSQDPQSNAPLRNHAWIQFDSAPPVQTPLVRQVFGDLATDVNTEPEQPGLELRSPSNGLFVLHRVNNSAASIQVFSILGIKVFETRLQPGSDGPIDLRTLPTGRYFVRIESAGQVLLRSVGITK